MSVATNINYKLPGKHKWTAYTPPTNQTVAQFLAILVEQKQIEGTAEDYIVWQRLSSNIIEVNPISVLNQEFIEIKPRSTSKSPGPRKVNQKDLQINQLSQKLIEKEQEIVQLKDNILKLNSRNMLGAFGRNDLNQIPLFAQSQTQFNNSECSINGQGSNIEFGKVPSHGSEVLEKDTKIPESVNKKSTVLSPGESTATKIAQLNVRKTTLEEELRQVKAQLQHLLTSLTEKNLDAEVKK